MFWIAQTCFYDLGALRMFWFWKVNTDFLWLEFVKSAVIMSSFAVREIGFWDWGGQKKISEARLFLLHFFQKNVSYKKTLLLCQEIFIAAITFILKWFATRLTFIGNQCSHHEGNKILTISVKIFAAKVTFVIIVAIMTFIL